MKHPLLLIISIFQVFTLGLYYYGPIKYGWGDMSPSVAVYVIVYLAMLNLGYFLAKRYYFKGISGPSNHIFFVKFSASVTLLIFPFALLGKVGDLSSTASLGDLYGMSGARKAEGESWFDYIRIFLGYFLFGLFPVLIWYRKSLPKHLFVLGCAAVVSNLIITILTGVNKVLFDYIIIAVCLILYKSKASDLFSRRGVIAAIFTGCCVVAAAAFFVEGQITRYGSSAISGENPRIGAYSEYSIEDGKLKVLYSSLTGYLSQGYRAFDLALDKQFEFTWGVGHSTFLTRQVDRLLGTNIADNAYPAKIEEDGWDRYINWSTFYVWWASDLSFYGVAFLMLMLGMLFRCVENTLSVQGDLSAMILYSYILILLFYLSANNQVFQSGEMAIGFLDRKSVV